MPASQESALNKKYTLFITPNWLGDCLMAMSAIEIWHKHNPEKNALIVTRSNLTELWQMHKINKEIIVCNKSILDIIKTARKLKNYNIEKAFIFPNSPRSAILPFLSSIPERYGFAGYYRNFMLTNIIHKQKNSPQHQIAEYLTLLNCKTDEIMPPALTVPAEAKRKVENLIENKDHPVITLIPGAARGKSKQWHHKNFAELGKKLLTHFNCLIAIPGTQKEYGLCEQLAGSIGNKAINLAGKTSLSELAALLALSKIVVANDSGGMHLAAALGTPTVAIFGITDPAITGPIGKKVMILKSSPLASRDIARNSEKAIYALKQITPQMAFDAIKAIINTKI
jgi:heptosyltransferase-2